MEELVIIEIYSKVGGKLIAQFGDQNALCYFYFLKEGEEGFKAFKENIIKHEGWIDLSKLPTDETIDILSNKIARAAITFEVRMQKRIFAPFSLN